MVSVITPWRNHPELLEAYTAAVAGADVLIVDNSDVPSPKLLEAVDRRGWRRLAGSPSNSFARSNNYAYPFARGNVIMFLNNDVVAPAGWLEQVERDVRPGALYSPSRLPYQIDAEQFVYLEGWCLAATRGTWDQLGGWDEGYLGGYWEDCDLCWRALQLGLRLSRTTWPIQHLGNTTAKDTPGAYDQSVPNFERLQAKVRAARQAVPA